jgi:hypothetical protein
MSCGMFYWTVVRRKFSGREINGLSWWHDDLMYDYKNRCNICGETWTDEEMNIE